MTELERKQAMLRVLTCLVDEWGSKYRPEDIRSDTVKVETLELARRSLCDAGVIIPQSVRDFYKDVYLRDVW